MNVREFDRQVAQELKRQASGPKGELIRLQMAMEECSEAQARKLSRIIGELEHWQRTGFGAQP